MAQLRQDFEQFVDRDVAILIVGPDDAHTFTSYFAENDLPFTGLPDPRYKILKKYGQEVKLFKFGRMPAQVLVDKKGIVRFGHYGESMRDIPSNEEMFALVDQLNEEANIEDKVTTR